MNILVITETEGAVATIRLLSPMAILEKEGLIHLEVVTLEKPQSFDLNRIDKQDIIVFQRVDLPEILEILHYARKKGKKTVYDIDDDLFAIPKSHPLFDHFQQPAVRQCIEGFLREVDYVTVSTVGLQERLLVYNRNTTTIQNHLDENIFPAPRPKSLDGPCRIGYAGGWTHEKDFQQVLPAIQQIRSEYNKEVSLVFFWYIPAIYRGDPGIEHLGSTVDIHEFGRRLNQATLDIGLAPLAWNRFNEVKSDEKYLEYASQKIAGIYSGLAPYSESVVEGQAGLLVEREDPDEWYEKIKYLIENPKIRFKLQEQAYEQITVKRNISLGAQKIAQFYEQILTRDQYHADIGSEKMVSVIMLTFNELEYTQRCVDSIQRHTNYPHELVFVENGSTDGTKEYLRNLVAENPNYQMIDNETNIGFSAGNNQGARAAHGKYLLMLNNDVLVGEGWLENLVSALEQDERIGLIGPISNHISGRQQLTEVPYKDDEEFFSFAKTVRNANQGKVTPRRRIAGFAMLIRKQLFHDLDGLDERFGSGNYEDDDLCLRVCKAGYAVMVDESTILHHFGSRTFAGNKIDYQDSLRKNEDLFREKWPDIEPDWLLEKDESLISVLERKTKQALQYVNGGDLEKGEALCREVLSQDPLRAEAVYGLGLVYHLRENLGEARIHYDHAVSLQRDWAPLHQGLAMLDIAEGDIQSAQLRLGGILEKNPVDVDTRRLLGQTFIETEHFEEGIQLLMGILHDEPNDWQTHFILASLYAEVDRTEDVKRHLEAVLAANPDHHEAREMLAKINQAN
jgi:GT2 family glycosyltransferase/glycosyltransferase involved in cell wall biosynthesis/Flp pilus assembly protein TadD